MDEINLKLITMNRIVRHLIQIEHNLESEDVCTAYENYFRQLPFSLQNELLDIVMSKELSSLYICLFYHEGRKHLIFPKDYNNFNFSLLLDCCSFKMSKLKVLTLPNITLLEPDCFLLSTAAPNLTCFEMAGGSISGNGMKHFAKLSLEKLNLRNVTVLRDTILQLCNGISKAKNTLQQLQISVRESNWSVLLPILDTMPQLEQLHFYMWNTFSKPTLHTIDNLVLPMHCNLKSIKLAFSTDYLQCLKIVTKNCRKIETLKLRIIAGENYCSSQAMKEILSFIYSVTSLKTLHLFFHNLRMTATHIKQLAQLHFCLKKLTLSYAVTAVKDPIFDKICFPHIATLRILENEFLPWTTVTILKSCPNVENLHYCCSHIHESLVEMITNGGLQKLKKLTLQVEEITPSIAQCLLKIQSLEQCEIPAEQVALFVKMLDKVQRRDVKICEKKNLYCMNCF